MEVLWVCWGTMWLCWQTGQSLSTAFYTAGKERGLTTGMWSLLRGLPSSR